MRPLRLELEGFTSFRERTEVSFEDTDLFVLTGATGSGKSSLIDAMVFSLYGSVPRYDDRRLVAPVISQGKLQARVRLDFEAGGAEYTAVRVVRRTSSGGASTREAVLEQKAPDDRSRTLARTADELSNRVENEVIGLGLEHFTKCVVLPQGEFATFMRAKAAERQKLLERLLGLGIYDRLQKAVNRRASDHANRSDALEDRLVSDLAGATADAVRTARAHVSGMEALRKHIEGVESDLDLLDRAAREAERDVAEAARRRELLAGATLPEYAEVLSLHGEAADAAARAEAALAAAVLRHRGAREIRKRLPESASLQRIMEKRRELADRGVELGQAWRDVAEAEKTLADLASSTPRAVEDAEAKAAALELLADRIRDAKPGLAALGEAERRARHRAAEIERQRSALAGVVVPEEMESLAALHHSAAEAARAAAEELETVHGRREEARAARTALPERASLERIQDEWRGLADREEFVRRFQPEVANKQAELAEALAREQVAACELEAANSALEASRREHSAADLARHLEEGEPCPVCLQEVPELSLRDPPPGLDAARQAAETAATSHRGARAARRERECLRDEAVVTLREREAAAAGMRERLAAGPDRAEIAAGIAAIEAAEGVLQSAEAAVESADREETAAVSELDALQPRMRAAWAQYRDIRDRVAGMQPPKVNENDLGASWSELSAWALERAGELCGEASAALAEAEAKRMEKERGEAELWERCRTQGIASDEADDPATKCAAALGEARGNVLRVKARLEERERVETALAQAKRRVADRAASRRRLEESLADAPDPEAVRTLLAKIADARRDLAAAEASEDEARAARSGAVEDLAKAEERLRSAWRDYHAARGRLAELKPPAPHENDLEASANDLAAWRTERDAKLAAEEIRAVARKEACEVSRRRTESRLREHCRAQGLDLGAGDPPATRCAEALGSAREGLRHLCAATEERERVSAESKAERRMAQVAGELGRHLNAHHFRRWLQNQVLKWLVEGATAKLKELSSGQYSLGLDHRNEFQVIDHRNADEPRPAKTLSGGETFLASLALALSLAEQIAGLAAHGSPKLDALFLDEGFGSLDPETLDVVAASIDQLGAERMVGLVTHVSELAERIPVQYRVKKVGNCSSVERVET